MDDDREILAAWRSGTLDPDGRARLDGLLSDPVRMRALTTGSRFDAVLEEALRRDARRTRLARRLRGWIPLAVAAAIVAWVAVIAPAPHPAGSAEPIGSPALDAGERMAGPAGERIEPLPGVSLRIEPGSRYRVEGTEVLVSAGTVHGMGGIAGSPMRFLAGPVRISASGALTVATDGSMASVRMAQGVATVTRWHDGEAVALGPGSALVVRRDGAMSDSGRSPGPGWADGATIAVVRLYGLLPDGRNPRGWRIPPEGGGAGDPAVWPRFARAQAEHAAREAARLRAAGVGTVILWDIEGYHPPGVLYAGAPERLADLAPEMDAAADGIFSAYARAGLRTGVLLRPERLVRDPAGIWRQEPIIDHGPHLASRAAHAHQRWGCTAFFINASTQAGRGLSAGTVDAVRAAVPGARVIVEEAAPADGSAASWEVAPLGRRPAARPGAVRAIYIPRGAVVHGWDPRTDVAVVEATDL